MAVTALLGGPLNAGRLCSPISITAVTLIGACLAKPVVVRAVRRLARRPAVCLKLLLPYSPLMLAGLFMLISSMSAVDGGINTLDDAPFYMTLPLKMLQTGAAIEPLNGRRLSTFGGYAFLQAQIGVVGNEWAAFVVDKGLSSIVVVLLVVGLRRRRYAWRWVACLVGAMVWLFPVYRANTMAALAITALVLATLRTVQLADLRSANRLPLLVLAGLTATAVCTFRDNILALPPIFFSGYFAYRFHRFPADWRVTLKETIAVAATGLLALLPWSVALYQACGSFLYPLMKGNQRDPYFDFVLPGTTWTTRLSVVQQMILSRPFLLSYIPVVFVLLHKQWTTFWMFVATLLMAAMTAYAFPTAEMGWLERFNLPALMAITLVAFDLAMRPPPTVVRGTWLALLLILFISWACLWPFSQTADQLNNKGRAFADSVRKRPDIFAPGLPESYRALQQSTPEGATILSILDYPTLLDFKRNTIYCVDIPGGATKTGLWPYHGTVRELQEFLLAQGGDYVVFGEFGKANGLYAPRDWIRLFRTGDRTAPRMLDMMGTVEALAKICPVVHHADGYIAFRIR